MPASPGVGGRGFGAEEQGTVSAGSSARDTNTGTSRPAIGPGRPAAFLPLVTRDRLATHRRLSGGQARDRHAEG